MKKSWNLARLAPWIVIAAGIALTFVQLVFNRSLSLDEASLGLNIHDRSFGDLLKPLDYVQVAPFLFLWIEKASSFLASDSELPLRIFPWLAWCGSLFLFWGVLKKVLSNDAVIVFALAMFALDPVLLRYSSELKQYMSDVLLATAMGYLLVHPELRYRLPLIGAAGLVGIALSNIAPIILLGCGAFLIYEYLTEKRLPLVPLIVTAVVWSAAFLLYYWVFINHHPSRSVMDEYWARNDAFMPWNPLHRDFWHFFKKAGNTLVNDLLDFGFVFKFLFPVLFALGVFAIVKDKRFGIGLLFVLPIVIHVLVSGFRLYPFATRLILYLAPAALLLISLGLEYLFTLLLKKTPLPIAWWVVLIFIGTGTVLTGRQGFPIQSEEIKRSMDYIQAHAGKDDQVYVYYRGGHALDFYQRIGRPFPSAVVHGVAPADNEPAQILGLQGRVWILFAHTDAREESFILDSLAAKGIAPEESFHTVGSSAYRVVLPAHPAVKTD